MKITEVTREISHTINMGNYNNIKPMIRITAQFEEDDKLDEALPAFNEFVEDEWEKIRLKEMSRAQKK